MIFGDLCIERSFEKKTILKRSKMGEEGVRCWNNSLFYACMMYTGPLPQLKLAKNNKKSIFGIFENIHENGLFLVGFLTKFVGFHDFLSIFVHWLLSLSRSRFHQGLFA